MKRISVVPFCCMLLILGSVSDGFAQCGLLAGPMIGNTTMLEVTIWVQTKCAETVRMEYWVSGKPDTTWTSEPVMTTSAHGFCAHLIADNVKPATAYDYRILVDDEPVELPFATTFQTQSQWVTEPPEFTFVAGSCAYINDPLYEHPGKPYGGDYQIFSSILSDDPDFMVWLGDNIYLRDVDFGSRTGIYRRYTLMRSTPELRPLLASVSHYATWDDHDFGPNDSDGSYWDKTLTLEAFKDYWANPDYGVGGTEGVAGSFTWGDCQFFLLDDRWYREPQGKGNTYFGTTQIHWLIDALRYSKSSFKFICTGGQILNDAAVFENYAVYAKERQALLDSLDKYHIHGVVFLTGDRHHSEISRVQAQDGNIFYDITSSPFTSTPSPHPEEPNHNRVPGAMVSVRNYALISVSGPLNKRVCHVTFKDADGNVQYEYFLK